MTEILTLDAAREHMKVEEGDISDDALLDLIASATAIVEDELGRPILDPLLGWPSLDKVPANVIHAIRIVTSCLFEDSQAPKIDEVLMRRLLGRYTSVSVG